jgi:hypothetical protein
MLAYNSISAQAAFFTVNGMIPYLERGDYKSAAGKYNTGDFNGCNEYTRKVATMSDPAFQIVVHPKTGIPLKQL